MGFEGSDGWWGIEELDDGCSIWRNLASIFAILSPVLPARHSIKHAGILRRDLRIGPPAVHALYKTQGRRLSQVAHMSLRSSLGSGVQVNRCLLGVSDD